MHASGTAQPSTHPHSECLLDPLAHCGCQKPPSKQHPVCQPAATPSCLQLVVALVQPPPESVLPRWRLLGWHAKAAAAQPLPQHVAARQRPGARARVVNRVRMAAKLLGCIHQSVWQPASELHPSKQPWRAKQMQEQRLSQRHAHSAAGPLPPAPQPATAANPNKCC